MLKHDLGQTFDKVSATAYLGLMTSAGDPLTSARRPGLSPHRPERVAVVGSGVSGLTAAYLLSRDHEVTLYEADHRLGGHAHTHTVATDDGDLRVDTGFIVHNERTYPLLRRLFAELGIATRPTEMSMSVRDDRTGLEYAGGKGVGGFLAHPRALASRDYLGMLLAVRRFHRLAAQFLDTTAPDDQTTYGQFIASAGFGDAFRRLYAVPVVSCVWSSGPGDALDYPARYLFEFLRHHGMLGVTGSPQWRTVVGGSATYVAAVAQRITHVRQGHRVTAVTREPDGGVVVRTATGAAEPHDRVVVATHADQALALLADATPLEKQVLGAFRYSRNETVLHRDLRLLPRAPRARAAWNYLVPDPVSAGARGTGPVVTYWMNRLQGLPASVPLLVTLNARDRIAERDVIAVMDYRHPIHDLAAVTAQRLLPQITTATTAFAGAYHGWGFHEDGARSGVQAAADFGVTW
jgi:predicted NAD/FAD-binding protein